MRYEYNTIDKKWQKKWEEAHAFEAKTDTSKPKYFALVEFPYPSGQGLHIGHPRPYTAMDIISRKKRMQGYNVLFPLGWDAFGLPTENYAIKHQIQEQHRTLHRTDQSPRSFLRLVKRDRHHRSLLLQVDAVDLPAALQKRTCLQKGNGSELLHLL